MKLQDRHRFKLWEKKAKKFITKGISVSVNPEGQVEPDEKSRVERVDCTGLRDVDEILIYEGDIIDIQGARAIVEWVDDGWKLIGDGFNGDDLFPQIRSLNGDTDLEGNTVDGKAMWGKIIGNRFEHNVDDLMKG